MNNLTICVVVVSACLALVGMMWAVASVFNRFTSGPVETVHVIRDSCVPQPRFCKDCKHRVIEEGCSVYREPVNGNIVSCSEARIRSTMCGDLARDFEPKEEESGS